jgi:hypothetical protein
VPVAVYGQFIGEDEAGFLPAKFLGLAGAEAWGGARDWTWRAYAEYSHTACDFARSTPTYGCAYESAIYTDGYRYRGRAIGHAHDRDSEGWTFGAVATRDGWSAHVRGYDVQLNEYRSGERHTLAANGGRLKGVEASVRATRGTMSLRAGVGYDDASGTGLGVERGLKAFLEWRHAT